jgi:hypothetical protein
MELGNCTHVKGPLKWHWSRSGLKPCLSFGIKPPWSGHWAMQVIALGSSWSVWSLLPANSASPGNLLEMHSHGIRIYIFANSSCALYKHSRLRCNFLGCAPTLNSFTLSLCRYAQVLQTWFLEGVNAIQKSKIILQTEILQEMSYVSLFYFLTHMFIAWKQFVK